MPISGGEAAKLGNSYENTWLSLCLARVLLGEIRSVHIEPLGDLYSIAELRLTANDGKTEYHQVKRQNSNGAWTVSRLLEETVLQRFADILKHEPYVTFRFLSQGESDQLRTLTDDARTANDWTSFERFYLPKNGRDILFEKLQIKTHLSDEQTFQLLKSIHVIGGSDLLLRDSLKDKCINLTNNTKSAHSLELVLREISQRELHKDWDQKALHNELERSGIELSTRIFPNSILALITEQTQQYLQAVNQLLIGGEQIVRQEAKDLFERIDKNPEKNIFVVTGDAGSGKTTVCAQLIELANQQNWITLGLELERLTFMPNSQKQLGEAFGLPDSPLRVLMRVQDTRKKLLVIDQLDHVSSTSGRLKKAFETVCQALKEVETGNTCFIVLACRHYDLTNDIRLRKLVDERAGTENQKKIEKLTEQQVTAVLKRTRHQPLSLSRSQLQILRTPLFLKLYVDLSETAHFQSEHELFREFWLFKTKDFSQKYPMADIKGAVAYLLSELRSQKTLSIRDEAFRVRYPVEFDYLLSERILSRARGMIGFFHESLFDFLLALHFVSSGEALIDYLKQQDQMLHCRGVMRQGLALLRVDNFQKYAHTVDLLLKSHDVRFLLKRSIFDWLRALKDPKHEELEILLACRGSRDQSLTIWSELTMRSPEWFDLIHKSGLLQRWIEGSEAKDRDLAVNLVWIVARERATTVAPILNSWLDLGGAFSSHAAKILQYMELDKAEGLAELYLRLLDQGVLSLDEAPFGTQTRLTTFELATRSPSVAMHVLEGWFSRVLADSRAKEVSNPFKCGRDAQATHRFGSSEDVLKIAKACPENFATFFLPTVMSLARENLDERFKHELMTDSIWHFKIFNSRLDLSIDILEGLVVSLQTLGQTSPEQCTEHITLLLANMDLDISCWILVRMLQSNGEAFADTALELLTTVPASLSQSWSNCHNFESKRLIAAIVPFLRPDQLTHLFDAILVHYEAWEHMQNSYDPLGKLRNLRGSALGFSQYQLLSAIDRSLFPQYVYRRWYELERKFGEPVSDEPSGGVMASFTTSPIMAPAGVLTDAQWLSAIDRYARPDRRDRWLERGGERELARHMAEDVGGDPSRLVSLLLKLPPSASSIYVAEALRRLRSIDNSDGELLWELIRIGMTYPNGELARDICFSIGAAEFDGVPSDVLAFLTRLEQETGNRGGSEEVSSRGDLEHYGLNSDRGAIAYAFQRILWKCPSLYEELRPSVEALVCDPSAAVRSQAATILLPLLNIDRDVAVQLFLKLTMIDSPPLLGSSHVFTFMRYAIQTHFEDLKELIHRMLESTDDTARNFGGQFVAFLFLTRHEWAEMFEQAWTSDSFVRTGVAKVAADLVRDDHSRIAPKLLLLEAFNSEDASVRKAAASCFREMNPTAFENLTDLVSGYICSRAFEDDAFHFFELLKETSARLPDVVLKAFEKTTDLVAHSISLNGQLKVRYLDRDMEIVVRLYEQTNDEAVRSRCLDIIDSFCRSTGVSSLDELLGSHFLG